MSQCLFTRVIAAIMVVVGALLVVYVPISAYRRALRGSVFNDKRQPLDFVDNFNGDLLLPVCTHECSTHPIILAKTCGDLQRIHTYNRTAAHMLLWEGRGDELPCAVPSEIERNPPPATTAQRRGSASKKPPD
ncbi:hypothetical protein PENTCL1PPCAC_3438 [Pristionchus entomophagus]|uniref:Uncharacterized protein n=1 Tax=Pristionchus entomophagus TaxID=358040 RepID=A0AAV5SGE6_9BILA|nr:hypothetical protein PENTCL1PPCAC_3438 [Pristionchus entomophagus]